MDISKAKFIGTVKVPSGLIVRDRPAPQSAGSVRLRTEHVGMVLYIEKVVNVGGVDYARLCPQNPQRLEWARVAEADRSIVYLEIESLENQTEGEAIAAALNRIADALERMK